MWIRSGHSDTDLDVEEVEAEVEEVERQQRGEEHHRHRHQHLGRPLQPRDLPQSAHALEVVTFTFQICRSVG